MIAVTVAVRIDVYGVVYALLLGILLGLPRPLLPPVWMLYLFVHGVLLLVQYFFLLGAPASVCYTGQSGAADNRTGAYRLQNVLYVHMYTRWGWMI